MSKPIPREKMVRDEDFDLIQAINAGEVDRFHQLVQKYQRKLYNFGLRMCGEARDAEDLVQDTFMNVFRFLDGFRHETKFKNWLFRIATTACLKKKRKNRQAPERELSMEELAAEVDACLPDDVPEWAKLPLERVLNGELSKTLKTAILELPKPYRMIVVLRDMEGFSTAETSEILGISESNAKVRLHRARLFLRQKLKGYYDHAPP
ncbi:MAG: RNA polymerase sigma factor [Desulfobacterales bacterium]